MQFLLSGSAKKHKAESLEPGGKDDQDTGDLFLIYTGCFFLLVPPQKSALKNLVIVGKLGGTSVLSHFFLLGGISSILRTFWGRTSKKNTLYFLPETMANTENRHGLNYVFAI